MQYVINCIVQGAYIVGNTCTFLSDLFIFAKMKKHEKADLSNTMTQTSFEYFLSILLNTSWFAIRECVYLNVNGVKIPLHFHSIFNLYHSRLLIPSQG